MTGLERFHAGLGLLFQGREVEGPRGIAPRGWAVAAVCFLTGARDFSVDAAAEPVGPDDLENLQQTFEAAFGPTVECSGSSRGDVAELALRSLQGYFQCARGEPLPESLLLRNGPKVAAAALLVQKKTGPHLDLLFIHPDEQRRGLASRLVGTSCARLREGGNPHLTSAYQLVNRESAAWHRRFGFQDIPDLCTEEIRWRFCARELDRERNLGHLSQEREAELSRQIELSQRRVKALREGQAGVWALARTPLRAPEGGALSAVLRPGRRGEPLEELPWLELRAES